MAEDPSGGQASRSSAASGSRGGSTAEQCAITSATRASPRSQFHANPVGTAVLIILRSRVRVPPAPLTRKYRRFSPAQRSNRERSVSGDQPSSRLHPPPPLYNVHLRIWAVFLGESFQARSWPAVSTRTLYSPFSIMMIATVIELAELLRIQIKIQVVQCVVGDAGEQRIEIHTVARRELVQQEHAASVAMVIMDSISFRRFRKGETSARWHPGTRLT
jgi:hypothetical protein